jgi:hypothetical protein
MDNLELLKGLEGLHQLAIEQDNHLNYLYDRCWHCAHHSTITLADHTFYICNDNWSGMNVGDHITYSETIDLCIECKGFTEKHLERK